jgi:hypothetical protein
MAKLTKNQKVAIEKIEPGKQYTVAEASTLIKFPLQNLMPLSISTSAWVLTPEKLTKWSVV